jgi:hypothetical protein
MLRDLTGLAVLAAVALSIVPARAVETASPCRSRAVDSEDAPRADVADGSLRLQGRPAAVRLEACRTTVAAVLSAFATTYKISYRSSIALNEAHYGTYAGPLGQVIARVLDGYDYVIKHKNSHLDVIIYGKKGEKPVAAPIVVQVSQDSARLPHQVSRTR